MPSRSIPQRIPPGGRERRPSLAILLILAAATSVALSAQSRQLRLVSTAWPPFTNETGKPRFALDLVEAALRRIGLTMNTTIVEAPLFTSSLNAGPFDGSAAVWKDPERELVLLFSQPYLENRLILVGRRGADVSAATLGALKGKRVAIVEGYSYGDVDRAGPVFTRSRSEEDSLTMLLSSGVDYTLMDELVVEYILRNYPSEARTRLQLGSTPLVTRPLYLAVRRSFPDAQSIVNRFNAELRGMIVDGTNHRLLHVDWILADVDGDGKEEYVPRSNRAGPTEPDRTYNLFTAQQPAPPRDKAQQRYFFNGNVYNGWTAVPEMYKAINPDRPEPTYSVANIFRFSW